jgi:hypothetical protein
MQLTVILSELLASPTFHCIESTALNTFALHQFFHAQGIILFHMDTVTFRTLACPKLFRGASELLLAHDSNGRCWPSVAILLARDIQEAG